MTSVGRGWEEPPHPSPTHKEIGKGSQKWEGNNGGGENRKMEEEELERGSEKRETEDERK